MNKVVEGVVPYGARVYRFRMISIGEAQFTKDSAIVLAVIALSLAIPVAAGTAFLALRGRASSLIADARGIALQTVIIMVVLLAIAGGVAAVLLARGGEAVSDIENQNITREAGDFKSSALCDAAGHTWVSSSSTCT